MISFELNANHIQVYINFIPYGECRERNIVMTCHQFIFRVNQNLFRSMMINLWKIILKYWSFSIVVASFHLHDNNMF